VAQNTMIYATKGSLEMTVKYMYMALLTSTDMEIWIDEGRPVDVFKMFGGTIS
jgi:hypothetical protein